jgi:hypothetical protein
MFYIEFMTITISLINVTMMDLWGEKKSGGSGGGGGGGGGDDDDDDDFFTNMHRNLNTNLVI